MSTKSVFYQPYKSTLQEIKSGLRVEKCRGDFDTQEKIQPCGKYFQGRGMKIILDKQKE